MKKNRVIKSKYFLGALFLCILMLAPMKAEAVTYLYYINADTTMYSDKSTSSASIKSLGTGTIVVVDSVDGDWCQISHGSDQGYVKSIYLQREQPGFTGTIHGVDGNELGSAPASSSDSQTPDKTTETESAQETTKETSDEETETEVIETADTQEDLKINQEFDEQEKQHEALAQQAEQMLSESEAGPGVDFEESMLNETSEAETTNKKGAPVIKILLPVVALLILGVMILATVRKGRKDRGDK